MKTRSKVLGIGMIFLNLASQLSLAGENPDYPNWQTSNAAADCVLKYNAHARSAGIPFDQIGDFAYDKYPGDDNFFKQGAVEVSLGLIAIPAEVALLPVSIPIIVRGKMGANLADKMYGAMDAKSPFYDRLLKEAQNQNPKFTLKDFNFALLDGFANEFCKHRVLASRAKIRTYMIDRARTLN